VNKTRAQAMPTTLLGQIGLALIGVLFMSAFSLGVIAPFNRSVSLGVIALCIAAAVASFVIPG